MLQILGYLATLANPLRLLSLGSFKDVELPVRVENRRCSHGLGWIGITFLLFTGEIAFNYRWKSIEKQ